MKYTSFTKTVLILLLTTAIILLSASCQSVPTDVPEDLTKADLIQLAQDSYDNGNKAAAKYYYELIIERYGDDDSSRIVAQFEIAHILIKDGDTDKARPMLEEIITDFDNNPELAYIIPEYLKLAKIDLEKCE